MGKYEELVAKYPNLHIKETDKLPHFQSGIYINGEIYINKDRDTSTKLETLAEEIAHHEITYGNILDSSKTMNRKYELKARRLANEILISLNDIIEAFKYGVHNLFELAEYLEVTEEFILNTIQHYKKKHGLVAQCGDYAIQFEPLRVFKYENIK
ncbi:ImmA/IrrE family metallo-endopeptidase [Staphylococcus haemolyticus]|uniref:ImmA/IrrE family metallo-endopeptidase n=1 Tax=Staphylococcus haemolyticus TaxID=1283 RepID=UPI003EE4E165